MAEVEREMTAPKYPEMRRELLVHLSHLADLEYRKRVWIGHEYPHPGYFDNFDETFEAIEDIVPLSDAQACIGATLRDRDEAGSLNKLGAALDAIFAGYGTRLSDAQYTALPEWGYVLSAAGVARELLRAKDSEAE